MWPAFMGLSVASLIITAASAASAGSRSPAGKICRSADPPQHPAFTWRARLSFGERTLAGVFPKKLATKKNVNRSWNQYLTCQAERPRCSPPHAGAAPSGSVLLESFPVPTTQQPGRNQVEQIPVGSNTQVPANWAVYRFLLTATFRNNGELRVRSSKHIVRKPMKRLPTAAHPRKPWGE